MPRELLPKNRKLRRLRSGSFIFVLVLQLGLGTLLGASHQNLKTGVLNLTVGQDRYQRHFQVENAQRSSNTVG